MSPKNFGRHNDKKALCNICKAEVASSGGTTNIMLIHKIDPAIQSPISNSLVKKYH
jgi:hypothetical protein